MAQPDGKDLIKDHRFIGLHRQMPGEKEIQEILQKMGKNTPEQELNCGACGYNTCREKAIAVYQGKADINMCLPFLTPEGGELLRQPSSAPPPTASWSSTRTWRCSRSTLPPAGS